MRTKTQIAVAIGAVLILAGVWYLGPGEKEPAAPVTADNSATTEQDGGDAVTSVTFADDDSDESLASATPSSSNGSSASPWPPRAEDRTGLPGVDSGRPQPAKTDEPPVAMTPTGLPGERAGLSVLPNMGTPAVDSVPPAGADMPPNADKTSAAVSPNLPDIKPLDIIAAPSSATQPAKADAASSAKPVIADRAPTTAAPSAEKLAEAVTEKPQVREHVVQSGDTYSSISLKHYGSVKYVNQLMKANPGKDAKRLFVGTKLVLPDIPGTGTAAPAAAKPTASADKAAVKPVAEASSPTAPPRRSTYEVPPPAPERSYTVQPGEGWYDLARKFLGKGENYPELYEYNKERVGGNPNLLRAGTVIELPPGSKLPAQTPDVTK